LSVAKRGTVQVARGCHLRTVPSTPLRLPQGGPIRWLLPTTSPLTPLRLPAGKRVGRGQYGWSVGSRQPPCRRLCWVCIGGRYIVEIGVLSVRGPLNVPGRGAPRGGASGPKRPDPRRAPRSAGGGTGCASGSGTCKTPTLRPGNTRGCSAVQQGHAASAGQGSYAPVLLPLLLRLLLLLHYLGTYQIRNHLRALRQAHSTTPGSLDRSLGRRQPRHHHDLVLALP
jgi:hypothetical protein